MGTLCPFWAEEEDERKEQKEEEGVEEEEEQQDVEGRHYRVLTGEEGDGGVGEKAVKVCVAALAAVMARVLSLAAFVPVICQTKRSFSSPFPSASSSSVLTQLRTLQRSLIRAFLYTRLRLTHKRRGLPLSAVKTGP